MHCGPPMEAMMSGMVMNGPIPTMLLMLSAVACSKPNPRIRPCESVLVLRLGSKDCGQYSGIGIHTSAGAVKSPSLYYAGGQEHYRGKS